MNGLVLSGGGARAAYQVGVLSYVTEKSPEIRFPIITGVSAGAINAAYLAAHRGAPGAALSNLADAWCELSVDRVFRTDLPSLGLTGVRWLFTLGGGGTTLGPEVRGLVDTSPLHDFLSGRMEEAGIETNVREGRLQALGLTVTRYATGQTITFVQGGPDVPTWERVRRCGLRSRIGVEHVMASCAIPLIFPAIEVDGEYYGDGSVRQAAPLAPAIHLGADRLLAVATRYGASRAEMRQRKVEGYPPPAQVLSMLFNTIFLDTLEADAERLDRINRVLNALPAGRSGPDGLRRIDLLVLRPSRDLGKLAGEYEKRLPRSVRFLLRGLGSHRVRRPDLLSYLLFEEPFIHHMIELGYEDALSQWSRIEEFFLQQA